MDERRPTVSTRVNPDLKAWVQERAEARHHGNDSHVLLDALLLLKAFDDRFGEQAESVTKALLTRPELAAVS